MNEFKSYEETVSEVLSRLSVQDLVEQSDEALARADRNFYKAKGDMEITDQGAADHINWWQIQSGENTYIVRRFRNFAWCSCRGFFFSRGQCCKHIARTANVPCAECGLAGARFGKLCMDCDHKIHGFMRSRMAA